MQGKNAQFLVTPEQLISSAQFMKNAVAKAKKEVIQLSALLGETDACFCGKAKEAFVNRGMELLSEWQELLNSLHNNATDLQAIAAEYGMAEGENRNVVMENGS